MFRPLVGGIIKFLLSVAFVFLYLHWTIVSFSDDKFYCSLAEALSKLNNVIRHPDAQHSDNLMAYDNAVSALGKICMHHRDGIDAAQVPYLFNLINKTLFLFCKNNTVNFLICILYLACQTS